jgi:hypothetical protein
MCEAPIPLLRTEPLFRRLIEQFPGAESAGFFQDDGTEGIAKGDTP